MVPDIACQPVFLGAPLIGTVAMALAAALVPIPGFCTPDPVLGDLLVLLYLLTVPAIVLMVAAPLPARPSARLASRAKWR